MNLTTHPATVDTGMFVPGNENPPIGGAWLSSRSVNDCRLTADERPVIRVKSKVGLYRDAGEENGHTFVKNAAYTPPTAGSKNSRRRAARYGR